MTWKTFDRERKMYTLSFCMLYYYHYHYYCYYFSIYVIEFLPCLLRICCSDRILSWVDWQHCSKECSWSKGCRQGISVSCMFASNRKTADRDGYSPSSFVKKNHHSQANSNGQLCLLAQSVCRCAFDPSQPPWVSGYKGPFLLKKMNDNGLHRMKSYFVYDEGMMMYVCSLKSTVVCRLQLRGRKFLEWRWWEYQERTRKDDILVN